MNRWLILLLFLGLVLRLALVPQPGFEADVAYWKFWSLTAADKGVVWLAQNTNYNYPAGFAWILWGMGKIYRLLASPENYEQFWSTTNYLFLFLAKLPSIMADLGAAFLIYFLVPRGFSLLLAGVYLFHPVVLLDGAWWGQVDSLLVVFLLAGLYFLFQKRIVLSTILITLGFLLKFQMMIFMPIYFLYLWRNYGWKKLGESLLTALIVFVLVNFPFSFGGRWDIIISLITRNADWFPVLSLRAFNLWWLYSGGRGLEVSDKILVLAGMSAKTTGLLFFSLAYGLACLLVFLKPKKDNFILSLIFTNFSFFLFPTQSHDRYLFPAVILSLLLIPIFWGNKRTRQMIIIFTTILSLTTLFNLNLSILAEHPTNGLPIISWFNFPFLSLIISAANLILYSVFAGFIIKRLAYEVKKILG